MGTSKQQDRCLSGGMSLSQWMKGKMDKFDSDDTTFQSPPNYEDNFYIRYKKSEKWDISRVTERESNVSSCTSQRMNEKWMSDSKEAKQIDFSKHPLSCQPFIQSINSKVGEIGGGRTTAGGNVRSKSQGTDDGFHGESALCGKSIVDVANQMMSGKLTKLLTLDGEREGGLKNVSKSLPATPLTSPSGTPDSSPKVRRKMYGNRYFSGAFVADREKYQGNWILGSILGQSREMAKGGKIEEEEEEEQEQEAPRKPLDRKKSISSQNLTYVGREEKVVYATVASELREMNCWSPTSM